MEYTQYLLLVHKANVYYSDLCIRFLFFLRQYIVPPWTYDGYVLPLRTQLAVIFPNLKIMLCMRVEPSIFSNLSNYYLSSQLHSRTFIKGKAINCSIVEHAIHGFGFWTKFWTKLDYLRSYRWFHIKGTWSVHSFNGDYLSILSSHR